MSSIQLHRPPTETSPPRGPLTVREFEPAPPVQARPDTPRARGAHPVPAFGRRCAGVGCGGIDGRADRYPSRITIESALVVVLAPAVAKVLGLYDRDQARLHKSTLDELPTLLQFAGVLVFLAWIVTPDVMGELHSPHGLATFLAILVASLVISRAIARRLAAYYHPSRALPVRRTERRGTSVPVQARTRPCHQRHARGADRPPRRLAMG